jgi:hypothetical protein
MRLFTVAAALVSVVAFSAATGHAATLNFTGTTVNSALVNNTQRSTTSFFLVGASISLSAEFLDSGNSSGSLSAASLTMPLNPSGTLTVASPDVPLTTSALNFSRDGQNDVLRVDATWFKFSSSPQSLTNLTGTIFLTRARTGGSVPLNVDQANVNSMLSAGTTYVGYFDYTDLNGLQTVALSGTIPVPEPGSIGLLAGLGMVCGRRIWRRRQQKKAEAAV